MHEQDEATQTQNILRYRRHCQAADKQAHMQLVHTQTEAHSTIRSHANQSQQMCEVRQVETVRNEIQRKTEINEGRNLEIKNEETERLMTFSRDRRWKKTVSQRCCLF